MKTAFHRLGCLTLVLLAQAAPCQTAPAAADTYTVTQPTHLDSLPAVPAFLQTGGQSLPDLLQLNRTVQREMNGGERHEYRVALSARQFLYAVVDQDGIDVGVALHDPAGHKLTAVDSWNGDYGPEPVTAIAENSGIYTIVVTSDPSSRPGRYSIRVIELRDSIPDDERRVAAEKSIERGMQLVPSGNGKDRDAALDYFKEALTYYETSSDDYRHGILLFGMGSLLADAGRFQEVLDYDTRALTLFKSSGSPMMAADALNSIGGSYNRLGEPAKAMRFHREALNSIPAGQGLRLRGSTLNNIGEIYFQMSEPASALDNYQQAVSVFTHAGDRREMALTLHNVANAYGVMGEREKAREFFDQSLAAWKLVHDPAGEANTLTEMSNALLILGMPEKAQESCRRGLELHQSTGDAVGEAKNLLVEGRILARLHRPNEAEANLAAALEKQTAIHDQRGAGFTHMAMGDLFLETSKPDAARTHFSQALTSFDSLGDNQLAARAMLGLAQAERALGNFEESLQHLGQALQTVEEVRSRIPTDLLRASFLGSWRSVYEFYIDLVLHFPRPLAPEGNPAFAFQIAEMARARSLLDTLNGAEAGRHEDEQEKNLRQELASQGTRLLELRLQGKTAEAAQIDLSIRNLETEYDRIESKKMQDGLGTAAPSQPRFLSADDVRQRLLDEQAIFLEYFLGPEKSYLWAITSGDVSVFELPAQSRIEESTRKFLDLLRSRGTSAGDGRIAELHRQARELTALVLSPVAERLRNRRLIVVADGPLQYLPFAALDRPQPGRSSSTAYTPLVLSNEIVSLPSASAFAAQQELLSNRPPAPRTLVVLADPVFSPTDPRVRTAHDKDSSPPPPIEQALVSAPTERLLEHVQPGASPGTIPRLPFTAIEADKIFAMAPAATSKKAVGFDAVRNLALSPELGDYRYLHFATHGYMDARHPELSALVLSLVDKDGNEKDGFLRLQDIYNLHLRADLVVLSACETGLGREIRGEGLIGLTRGFMYAGAARVVVSLWNVSDQGTSELMAHFYKNMLEQHMAPAAALRRAQIAMLASRQWQDPYYWAPFTLQGEWK